MKVIGIGVLLQTNRGTYLFQERDNDTTRHPGQIAAFGGGIEGDEDVYECAVRELAEELSINITKKNLQDIGLFESHHEPGIFIQMFLSNGIDPSTLRLHEGKNIVELSIIDALRNILVTDFTKEVLKSL